MGVLRVDVRHAGLDPHDLDGSRETGDGEAAVDFRPSAAHEPIKNGSKDDEEPDDDGGGPAQVLPEAGFHDVRGVS